MNTRTTLRRGFQWLPFVAILLSGCSLEYAVRLHAEGDLDCPDEKIEVEGGPVDYVARGCGRSQEYRCATRDNSRYCWKR